MRTTLVLDDQLFRRAKREAGNAGTTLSDLVNTALRKHLFSPLANGGHSVLRFSMPVYGEPSGIHQTPREIASLRDEGR